MTPNVPAQRPRASGSRYATETSSRGSLQPVCSAASLSATSHSLFQCTIEALLCTVGVRNRNWASGSNNIADEDVPRICCWQDRCVFDCVGSARRRGHGKRSSRWAYGGIELEGSGNARRFVNHNDAVRDCENIGEFEIWAEVGLLPPELRKLLWVSLRLPQDAANTIRQDIKGWAHTPIPIVRHPYGRHRGPSL